MRIESCVGLYRENRHPVIIEMLSQAGNFEDMNWRLSMALLGGAIEGMRGEEVLTSHRVIPLVQDGGGWTTTITIVNLSAAPDTYDLQFRTGFLQPWPLAAKSASAQGTLAPGAIATVQTSGTAEAAAKGLAVLTSLRGGRLGARAVLRHSDGRPPLIVPLSPEREDRSVLPFDNTNGASTSILWVSETPFALVDFTFLADDGAEIESGQFQFSARDMASQDQFALADRFPSLRNRKGSMRMTVSYPNAGIYDDLFFTAVALQSEPGQPATVVPAMATANWRASRH